MHRAPVMKTYNTSASITEKYLRHKHYQQGGCFDPKVESVDDIDLKSINWDDGAYAVVFYREVVIEVESEIVKRDVSRCTPRYFAPTTVILSVSEFIQYLKDNELYDDWILPFMYKEYAITPTGHIQIFDRYHDRLLSGDKVED